MKTPNSYHIYYVEKYFNNRRGPDPGFWQGAIFVMIYWRRRRNCVAADKAKNMDKLWSKKITTKKKANN